MSRIREAIREAAETLTRRGFQVHVLEASEGETKLLFRRDRIEVMVEANFVMRARYVPCAALDR